MMKFFAGFALILATLSLLTSYAEVDPPTPNQNGPKTLPVPIITVSDTINPGSADYIVSAIEKAETQGAPFLLIELDTPGGLLSATRQIVQKMLNSKVPVVVYVSPQGAHAGSAGALITFASDIAVMAPGTNIGAAHPVVPNQKMDETMAEKMTNDTAAFAESLAKSKGRNAEWAIKSVRESASMIAEKALENNVIDLIAPDRESLLKKLQAYRLRAPKTEVTALPDAKFTPEDQPMSIKQQLVSFFANPNIAYILMSFAGLCIWVELTNPGLIVPGVIGGICVILSMISFQMLPIHYGALAFILLGMCLLVAEAFVPSFGVLGISGIAAFVFGSLFLMDTNVPEFQISLSLIIPTALTLGAVAFAWGILILRAQKTKVTTGLDNLVGSVGTVKDTVTRTPGGAVMVQGELWNAVTTSEMPLPLDSAVQVKEVRRMVLVVDPAPAENDPTTGVKNV